MRSLSVPGMSRKAKRASRAKAAHFLARSGLIARAGIYLLVGWVAALVALGHSAREADQQGALQLLASRPYGLVLLWLLGIGLAAYALWRLSEAVLGVTGEPSGAGPRLKALGQAVTYACLSFLTFTVIAGSDRNQSEQQQDLTATAMRQTPGRVLVGVIGLIIVACGIALVVGGVRRKFADYLKTRQMTARTRGVVKALGVTGAIARGLVCALVGVLVVDAAATHKASESGGIDKALLTLRDQPLGEFLMLLAALGIFIFGIYGLCEARWRKV